MLRALLPLALAAALVQPPPPPYVRQSTAMVYQAYSYEPSTSVDGKLFYTANGETCSAWQLPSLNKRWSLPLKGESAGMVEAGGGSVFLATDPESRKAGAHLYALDPVTGRIRWSLPRQGRASAMTLDGRVLYLALAPRTLSALDLRTRKPIWSHTFPPAKEEFGLRDGVDAVTAAGAFVLANSGNVTYCLDAGSGRVRWSEKESYVLSGQLLVVDGVAAVPAGEGMVARDLLTGASLWRDKARGMGDGAERQGKRFILLDDGKLRAVEARTGREVWAKTLDTSGSSGGNQYLSVIGGRVYARGLQRAVIVDEQGKEVSAGSAAEALPQPFWTDGAALVCFDGDRLIAYRRGQEAPVAQDPAGKQQLARDLVRRWDTLDDREIARLKSLGDDAFDPVLAGFLAACAAHDASGDRPDSFHLYEKYHAMAQVLGKITTAKRTDALMAALRKAPKEGSAMPTLLQLAAEVGEPAVVTPFFLQVLKGTKTPGMEMYESSSFVARRYIMSSRDPRAVAFLVQQLRDPKADPVLREEAYLHVAGSGDPEAIKVVLAQRSHRSLLRPVGERVIDGVLNAGEFGTRTKVLGEKRDADGHAWGLLQSGVLGSRGDLWLAEKIEGKWTHALFTGVSTEGVSRWAQPAPPEPTIGGKTGKQLAAGAWLDILARNSEVRKDADGDGLTDLEERRLGTDPNKADTDGDGDPDNADPWPNAAPRKLTEEEQVYAAVFEARFHANDSEGPALVFAPGKMQPFEMPGRRGPSIWVPTGGKRWTHPLEYCYEQGIALVNFAYPDRESRSTEVIKWNKEHTEASVIISVYFGGLNGTGYRAQVRKIGNDWVVVAMDMAYVS